MRATGTTGLRASGALALLVLATSCAQIPQEGPVVDGTAPTVSGSAAPFDFSPPGPETGVTPEQVVAGFLVAQQATPTSTTVARQFLTDSAAEDWEPGQRTLLYGTQDVTEPPDGGGRAPLAVAVELRRVFALDGSGRWAGRQRALERSGLLLQVVREEGEWRVEDPPDALLLPLTHFENRYRRFAVHFTDPSGTVLVPEPIYLPVEAQTPTQLVESLLAGPAGGARAVDRTYLPPGTELAVSVPVDEGGVARVPVTGELLELSLEDLRTAVAQLVWTLRQVPGVRAVAITADGEPVAVPGIGPVVPADALEEYSPLISAASSDLYGLRGRRVLRVSSGSRETLVRLPKGIRGVDLAVSFLGNPVSVLDARGRVHVLARGAPRRGPTEPVKTVDAGQGTVAVWDWSRALWLVRRSPDDAVWVLLGGRLRRLPWSGPSLRGSSVQAATLSRDGSRLVLAVSRPGARTELLIARVERSADQTAAPVALRAGTVLATGAELPEVIDLGWMDELTLTVLVRPDRLRSRVLRIPVDDQRVSGALVEDSDVLFGRAVHMAASPEGPRVRVTTRERGVHVLSSQGRWQMVDVESNLRAATYVG